MGGSPFCFFFHFLVLSFGPPVLQNNNSPWWFLLGFLCPQTPYFFQENGRVFSLVLRLIRPKFGPMVRVRGTPVSIYFSTSRPHKLDFRFFPSVVKRNRLTVFCVSRARFLNFLVKCPPPLGLRATPPSMPSLVSVCPTWPLGFRPAFR